LHLELFTACENTTPLTEPQREFVATHWPLVRKLIREWSRNRPELAEEYHDAGVSVLVKDSRTYDPALGAPSTYLTAAITRQFRRLYATGARPLGYRGSDPKNETPQTFGFGFRRCEDGTEDPDSGLLRASWEHAESHVADEADIVPKEFWDHLNSRLNPRHAKILAMRRQGLSTGEIGKQLGVSRQRAVWLLHNAIRRAREVLGVKRSCA
jgi:RNA polymerase sigma factor (sigma-70 family)